MVCSNAINFMNYNLDITQVPVLYAYRLHGNEELYLEHTWQGDTYMVKIEIKWTTTKV